MKKILSIILVLSLGVLPSFSQNRENFRTANQLFINGNYAQAKTLYEKLYLDTDFKEIILDNYIKTLLALNDFNEAEKIAKKAVKDNPKESQYLLTLARVYQTKGNNTEYNKLLNSVVQNLPADEFAISQLANSFFETRDYELAIKVFLNGRKALNNHSLFSYELINLHRYLRQKDQLTQETLNLLESREDYLPTAKMNLSRTYENDEDYKTLKGILLKRVQKNTPAITNFYELLGWTYIQLKEYPSALNQFIALDSRLNGNGSKVYDIISILMDNRDFENAQKGLEYILSKGNNSPYYVNAKIALLNVKKLQLEKSGLNKDKALVLAKDYETLLAEYGKNERTLFAIRELSKIKANYLNDTENSEKLLLEALEFKALRPDEISNLKFDLADVNILKGNPWEASLLYGQIEKSNPNTPVGQEAKFRNARLSFYNGDFKWAKAQLDVLKASTSQLIANDALDLSLIIQEHLEEDSTNTALNMYARSEFFREQRQFEKALPILDSILLIYPGTSLTDDVMLSKSRIFLSMNNFELATQSFLKLINDFPESIWADDALYSLGIIYQDNLNDKNKAIQYFEQLINNFPGSLFVADARTRYRLLRGDIL